MRAFEMACSVPWAITEPALQSLLLIADRAELNVDEARAIAADRNDRRHQAVQTHPGTALDGTHDVTLRGGVALIPVIGPVSRYMNLFTSISGGTSIETLASDFQRALDDPNVQAIVLEIDSPGGTVAGVSEFADQVYAARGQKPIVAYVSALGCSAAYWIASAADRIVLEQTAEVGSIGVVSVVPAKSRKEGEPVELVSSVSPYKRPNPNTERGRDVMQGTVDGLADVFVATVARNRSVEPSTVINDFGQGWVKIGAEAVAAGLADEVGSLESVISELQGRKRRKNSALRVADSYAAGGLITEPAVVAMDATYPSATIVAETAAARSRLEDAMGQFGDFMEHLFGQYRAGRGQEEEPVPTPQQFVPPTTAAPGVVTSTANTSGDFGEPLHSAPIASREHRDEMARLQAENRRLREAAVRKDAEMFVGRYIEAGKLYPAESAQVLALYVQLAMDDAQLGAVETHDRQTQSRIGLLTAALDAQVSHNLTQEQIRAAGTAYLLENQMKHPEAEEASPARLRELRNHTPLGREVGNGHAS